MKPFHIAASILSANFAIIGEEVDAVTAAGANLIHFDVMDNHYVPNLTFGPMVCQSLINYGCQLPIDVHLMVKPVDKLINAFIAADAKRICFHPEASEQVSRSLQLITDSGCEAGIALNPATPVAIIEQFLPHISYVLVMSVNPGFPGQRFIVDSLEKIKQLKQMFTLQHRNTISIAVDGGINETTILEAAKAGADTFVMGSALFSQQHYQQYLARVRSSLDSINLIV